VAQLIHENRAAIGIAPSVFSILPLFSIRLSESELFGYERGAFTGAQVPYEGKLRPRIG